MADPTPPPPAPKQQHDPKSPPKSQRSHRALSQRAKEHSQREPEHEAFGLEPPPTQREITSMMLVTAVRTLSEFGSHPETVEQVCERCFQGQTNEKRQEAADAGALQAIVACMAKHSERSDTLEHCIVALGNIVFGTDAAGLARKQRAADSGVISAVLDAMRSHVPSSSVQENGSATLGNIASHVDDPGLGRKCMAVKEGACQVIVDGMRAHAGSATVQAFGSFALANLTRARGDVESEALGAEMLLERRHAPFCQLTCAAYAIEQVPTRVVLIGRLRLWRRGRLRPSSTPCECTKPTQASSSTEAARSQISPIALSHFVSMPWRMVPSPSGSTVA